MKESRSEHPWGTACSENGSKLTRGREGLHLGKVVVDAMETLAEGLLERNNDTPPETA